MSEEEEESVKEATKEVVKDKEEELEGCGSEQEERV